MLALEVLSDLQSFTIYLRQALVFMLYRALREQFNFYFSGDFCYCWQGFQFGGGLSAGP